MKKYLLTLALALTYIIVNAQETIVTDRPNVTDAVTLIAPGTFQIEGGFQIDNYGNGDTKLYKVPSLSFKYGLIDRIELRLLTNYQVINFSADGANDNTESGLSSLTLSPKIGLTEQLGWIPKTAIVTNFTFPNTGTKEFDVDEFQGGLTGLFEYTFGRITWTNSLGNVYTDDESGWAYTTVVGGSFTNRVGGFVELFGAFGSEFETTYNIDAGLTVLINNDMQADFIYGTTMTDEEYYFIGFGLSWRTNFKERAN